MRTAIRFMIFFCVVFTLWTPSTQACQYNIRDVAYVHFEGDDYHLYLYVNQDTPAETRKLLEEQGKALCLESNLLFRIIDVDADPQNPTLVHLPSNTTTNFPLALFKPNRPGPDPLIHSLPKNLTMGGLRDYITSPLRNKITEKLIEPYSVILLIEGQNITNNQTAETNAIKAIDTIEKLLPTFPKPIHAPAPIDTPPCLIKLPFDERTTESILLWSLGLENLAPEETACVVLYGRGRQLGPALTNAAITAASLTRILSIVGQDCECSLPREMLRGPTIPLLWSEETRAAAVWSLGFDPDSPMVRAEVAQIAGRAVTHSSAVPGFDPADLGYRELSLDLPTSPDTMDSPQPAPSSESTDEPSKGTLALIAAGALAVLLLSALAILRAWGKRS